MKSKLMNRFALRRVFAHLPFLLAAAVLILSACTPTPVSKTPAAGGAFAPLKILVSKKGMLRITADDLKAQHVDLSQIDPGRLQLTLRGKQQPLRVSGTGNDLQLVFYGTPSTSLYSAQNVYLLEDAAASPLPMPSAEAAPRKAAASSFYTQTVHFEENKVYSPLVENGDHWFIISMPAGQSNTYQASIQQLAPAPAVLRFAVWSSTTAPVNPNHHLRISVNGQVVIDEKWGGVGERLLQGSIPVGMLQEGENSVLVEAPGDTGAVVDTNFLNWFEIDYPHLPAAPEGAFELTAAGEHTALRSPADSYDIYNITDPAQTAFLGKIAAQGGQVTFRTQPGSHYWLVPANAYLKPAAIQPVQAGPDLHTLIAQPDGADYLAIGPADLLQALQPLLDLRASQGLHPAAAPLQAVYDQFSYGFPEPEGIRNFLAYASHTWKVKPKYVLLVGDATYDPRGYVSAASANQLPVFYVNTIFGGQTASDPLFGVLNPGERPSLAVGRIPAQQAAQVKTYVQKVLNYEAASVEAWSKTVVAVSDGQDASFKDDAGAFLGELPADFTGQGYNPPSGETGAAKVIQDYVDQGVGLIAYFGHGSVNMWGKDRLFTADEARTLKNAHLPVFVTMTCLNGYFIHPKIESLAEALLWVPDGGAVAVMAPTSLTVSSDQAVLRQPFMEALLKQKDSLGQALMIAQQKSFPGQNELNDVQKTFMLFGDPALHLK